MIINGIITSKMVLIPEGKREVLMVKLRKYLMDRYSYDFYHLGKGNVDNVLMLTKRKLGK